MLTLEQFLMGRIKESELSPIMKADAEDLLTKVNALLADFYTRCPDEPKRTITSGYRTPAANSAAGGAKKSNHMLCRAVDLSDASGSLDKWLDLYPEKLIEFDLYREASSATPKWVHLSNFPPKSKKRTFIP